MILKTNPLINKIIQFNQLNDEQIDQLINPHTLNVCIDKNVSLIINRLEKAKVNLLKVQNEVSLAKSGIALKVKKLETEILSKNADVKSYQKQLRFAEKVYENYRSRYKEGIVSLSDVLMKQSKELEVLLKLLTLKNERNTKIFELNSILNSGGKV